MHRIKDEEGYRHRGWTVLPAGKEGWYLWPPTAPAGSKYFAWKESIPAARRFIESTVVTYKNGTEVYTIAQRIP